MKKRIKSLEEVVGENKFVFPANFANDRDPETGKACIMVRVNSHASYIPVGEPTPVSYDVYCILKDVGIVSSQNTFQLGGDFDPLKPWSQI